MSSTLRSQVDTCGTIRRFADFPSRYVAPRHVDVWCPPDVGDGGRRFAVVYVHDGQNVFDSGSAFRGESWQIHSAVRRLMVARHLPGALLVGVWHSETRRRDYMPQKPYEASQSSAAKAQFVLENGGPPISDHYLKFLIEELKPEIDSNYPTLADREHTLVIGSSMGGLISLYAISEYPLVFGAAACLSTHWPIGGSALVKHMAASLPNPATHKLYFDFGTETLDAGYEPFQREMDVYLSAAGYIENENWLTLKFEGAEHSEESWRERVEIPLAFLLG